MLGGCRSVLRPAVATPLSDRAVVTPVTASLPAYAALAFLAAVLACG